MYDPEGDFGTGQTVGDRTTEAMAAVAMLYGIQTIGVGSTILEGGFSTGAAGTEAFVVSGSGLLAVGGTTSASSTATITIGGLYIAEGGLTFGSSVLLAQSSKPGGNSRSEGPSDPRGLAERIGDIAEKTGLSRKQVKDRIHRAKRNLPKDKVTNPDVGVDPTTGEIFPKNPDGGFGDSIGNIFDDF